MFPISTSWRLTVRILEETAGTRAWTRLNEDHPHRSQHLQTGQSDSATLQAESREPSEESRRRLSSGKDGNLRESADASSSARHVLQQIIPWPRSISTADKVCQNQPFNPLLLRLSQWNFFLLPRWTDSGFTTEYKYRFSGTKDEKIRINMTSG